MKIFPESNFIIELNNDGIEAISELKNRTLSNNQYDTNWNNQLFIGTIKHNEFKVKLYKKLFGEFCILNGKLENGKGILKISTNKIVKIIFIIVVLFIFSGIIVAIIQNKLSVIFDLIMNILVFRLILELIFKVISKSILNKLTKIIGIKELKKTL